MEYSDAEPVWPASDADDLTAYRVHFGELMDGDGKEMKFDQHLRHYVSQISTNICQNVLNKTRTRTHGQAPLGSLRVMPSASTSFLMPLRLK
jgi:hypothetical protein